MLYLKVNAQYLIPQQPAHTIYTDSLHQQHGQGGCVTRLQPTAEYITGNEEDILERWWLFIIFKGHKVQLCIKFSQNLSIQSQK